MNQTWGEEETKKRREGEKTGTRDKEDCGQIWEPSPKKDMRLGAKTGGATKSGWGGGALVLQEPVITPG